MVALVVASAAQQVGRVVAVHAPVDPEASAAAVAVAASAASGCLEGRHKAHFQIPHALTDLLQMDYPPSHDNQVGLSLMISARR